MPGREALAWIGVGVLVTLTLGVTLLGATVLVALQDWEERFYEIGQTLDPDLCLDSHRESSVSGRG